MIKKIFPLFILLLTVLTKTNSQDCFPKGVVFGTQDQIDSFTVNYPECTRIVGGVEIRENKRRGITNLKGLSHITAVGGQLKIFNNSSIKNFSGLENLNTIDGCLIVKANKSLTDFQGLENLSAIGSCLHIYNNASLENLENLTNLNSIGRYLKIHNNASLKSLGGLDRMDSIGSYTFIKENPSLLDTVANEKRQLVNDGKLIEYYTWAYSLNGTLHNRGELIAVKDSSISLLAVSKKLWAEPGVRNIEAQNIGELQFRKQGKVRNGVLIGCLSGFAVGIAVASTIKKEEDVSPVIEPISNATNAVARVSILFAGIGVGAMVGGIISSARIKIPINGNQATFAKNKREITKYIIMN
ncbi:MAG: hypothetical protein AAFZ15_18385 [Bacteroidota bacterium]